MESTSVSQTRATCKSCKAAYIRTNKYGSDDCPSCLIMNLHKRKSYMPGTDFVAYTNPDWFVVLHIKNFNGKYEYVIYTPDQYRVYGSRVPMASSPVYHGTLKECTAYIKSKL